MPKMTHHDAARYVGLNYDLSEIRWDDPETWYNSVELGVALDVLGVSGTAARTRFVRTAYFAYHSQGS